MKITLLILFMLNAISSIGQIPTIDTEAGVISYNLHEHDEHINDTIISKVNGYRVTIPRPPYTFIVTIENGKTYKESNFNSTTVFLDSTKNNIIPLELIIEWIPFSALQVHFKHSN